MDEIKGGFSNPNNDIIEDIDKTSMYISPIIQCELKPSEGKMLELIKTLGKSNIKYPFDRVIMMNNNNNDAFKTTLIKNRNDRRTNDMFMLVLEVYDLDYNVYNVLGVSDNRETLEKIRSKIYELSRSFEDEAEVEKKLKEYIFENIVADKNLPDNHCDSANVITQELLRFNTWDDILNIYPVKYHK